MSLSSDNQSFAPAGGLGGVHRRVGRDGLFYFRDPPILLIIPRCVFVVIDLQGPQVSHSLEAAGKGALVGGLRMMII